MKVRDLLKLAENAPLDADILIPVNQEFDGRFYSPCSVESGISQIPKDDLSEEEYEELELLGKEPELMTVLMLVPCGFYDEKDHSHELN